MKKIEVKGPIVSNDAAWLYHYLEMDAVCPEMIAKGLEEADGEDIIIEINSPGGVCVSGYEMYTNIMEYKGKVTAHVICAMSAATLIVCAADEALISDTGIFMIHNTSTSTEGNHQEMQSAADRLREFDASLINAYVRKTGKSREELQALMDEESYMSPQTAIEQGFVDGYMFGDPNGDTEKKDKIPVTNIVAADVPVIPEDKAQKLVRLIKESEDTQNATSQFSAMSQATGQKTGTNAVSDRINKEEGGTVVELNEFLEQNPAAKEELDAKIKASKEEGIAEERKRMQSLDIISRTVTAEALNEAKYGENPIDGPTLAYQAMCRGDRLAAAYMDAVREDTEDSGAKNVGIGKPDAGQEQTDEADEMADHVNKSKGGI